MKTALVKTAGQLMKTGKSPDEALGDLFMEVQAKRIYEDGKTFVDLVPKRRAREIIKEYNLAKQDPDFSLGDFVNRHFYEFAPHKEQTYNMSPGISPREHVSALWNQLERRNRKQRGSLIALPHSILCRAPGSFIGTPILSCPPAADGRW